MESIEVIDWWLSDHSPHVFIIPTAKTQIDTTNEGDLLIDDDEFLMMRPEKNTTAGIMIWMTDHLKQMHRWTRSANVQCARRTDFDEPFATFANQCSFRVETVQTDGK